MANVGYIRVSTADQHTERQLSGIELDRVFEDKLSGKDTNRPGFAAMMDYVRDGDTLHVHEMSRLGRNVLDILSTIEQLTARGVAVKFHKEGQQADNSSAMGRAFLAMMATFAALERDLMLERQQEGYRAAQAAGRITGRGKGKDVDRPGIAAAIAAGASIRAIAKDFGVSPQTVQAIKKEQVL
ncbi:recombinase family protein [Pantoea sp. EKM10T]|uniref:recombinase family protein n=1 Tax=Pantoea sp. EKM10T TaxID=2708058 RepID=UPI00142E4798|nr:recombinase family protein [Pantoea sp. EKM10T]KAF6625937.1 recombinase family protein [Pantoea sp. EKM10T]